MRLMAAAGMVQVEGVSEQAQQALADVAYEYRLGTFGSPVTLEQWGALHPAERQAMVAAGRLLLRDLIDDVVAIMQPHRAPAEADQLETMLNAATDQAFRRVVDEVTA